MLPREVQKISENLDEIRKLITKLFYEITGINDDINNIVIKLDKININKTPCNKKEETICCISNKEKCKKSSKK